MKIKPYKETHMEGRISKEGDAHPQTIIGDFGIQIAEDGRVWICINGISYLRFTPSNKYHTVKNKLNPKGGDRKW